MSTPTDTSDPSGPDNAAPFRRVADKIDTNRDNGFGGAFVIVPPSGPPIELLIVDDSADPAVFWSLVQTKWQIAMADLEMTESRGQPQARGRR